MAFEYKIFPDGDATFDTPKWKKIIEEIQIGIEPISYVEDEEKNKKFQEDEVGFKHPKNGSFVRIKDDGTIEAFTAYNAGIRIKKDNTMQIFSDKLQLIGNSLEFYSNPNSTNVNGEILGEGAYKSFPVRKGLSASFLEQATSQGIETYGLEDEK